MNFTKARFTLWMLPLCIAALVACGEEPERRAPLQSEPETAPPETTMHMGQYFEQVLAAQAALVRGDLEDAREPARWISEHESMAGLNRAIEEWASDIPEGWEAHDPEIRGYARLISEANTFEDAASAAAKMVQNCGSCHRNVGAQPRVLELGALGVPPSDVIATVPHMLRHQWAVHQMWIGMINPSDEAWTQGAEVLADAALEPENITDRAEHTGRVGELAVRVHELGAQALETQVWTLRAEIYGELLASCAGCHNMLGQGPE